MVITGDLYHHFVTWVTFFLGFLCNCVASTMKITFTSVVVVVVVVAKTYTYDIFVYSSISDKGTHFIEFLHK